ncbi:MAG: 6-phosphofructokinase [Oscillospiraceae bacterium]
MTKEIRSIGVLTSGGDAPGMNSAVRAVVRSAISRGLKVYGIRRGYNGLINGDIYEMDARSVSEILHRGGTVLYTARCKEFMTAEGRAKAKKTCEDNNIDGLIVIGGDGTFRGARELSLIGVPCIGIPATIDNDIVSTDYTIGFDTALNTAVEAIDKLRDTAQSLDRCSIVEVMGNGAGHLALSACVACGGLACILKESKFDIEHDIVDKIKSGIKSGKHDFIIIVSEETVDLSEFAKEVSTKSGIEARVTVLGHIQRGGSPTASDRILATRMGDKAVELLSNGIGNKVVVSKNGYILEYDILEALSMHKSIDIELLNVNERISI